MKRRKLLQKGGATMNRHDAYYARLFKDDPLYSTPYPNLEEARRWARMAEFLSRIADPRRPGAEQPLRMLDVGCGRGWMTRLAGDYGQCDGIDPVGEVVNFAGTLFPELRFIHGTLGDLVRSPDFAPYDVILCSEVLEHVEDKDAFVAGLRDCLAAGGHVILTTPRGELFGRYLRSGYDCQPVEQWLTERELARLFHRHGFRIAGRDRAYDDLPRLSLLHRALASRRVTSMLGRSGLAWLGKGLRHVAATYQVWWFTRDPGGPPRHATHPAS
jgi:2-polyprenyl-3-methyl-5-hydroxy-6-metoxy-1,4-benzoquinol methylase